jgi:ketosteroid isomerase-like protein
MDTRTLISRAYSAFNRRDIDGTLALMSENVSWPKSSEGGRVVGKQERVKFPSHHSSCRQT